MTIRSLFDGRYVMSKTKCLLPRSMTISGLVCLGEGLEEDLGSNCIYNDPTGII